MYSFIDGQIDECIDRQMDRQMNEQIINGQKEKNFGSKNAFNIL